MEKNRHKLHYFCVKNQFLTKIRQQENTDCDHAESVCVHGDMTRLSDSLCVLERLSQLLL
jgi:hypothetical protein